MMTIKIPNENCYAGSIFQPWRLDGEFQKVYNTGKEFTLVSPDRCYILYTLLKQTILTVYGARIECGVYRGGTAMMMAKIIRDHAELKDTDLYVFDTFEGMPNVDDKKDLHKKGDFDNAPYEEVSKRITSILPGANIIKGFIPDTFNKIPEVQVAFAHIDVDIYQSVKDCCEYLYPKMEPGGFMVFDDYGFKSCPGARMAVDEYFADKYRIPLVLPTGQAVVFY